MVKTYKRNARIFGYMEVTRKEIISWQKPRLDQKFSSILARLLLTGKQKGFWLLIVSVPESHSSFVVSLLSSFRQSLLIVCNFCSSLFLDADCCMFVVGSRLLIVGVCFRL